MRLPPEEIINRTENYDFWVMSNGAKAIGKRLYLIDSKSLNDILFELEGTDGPNVTVRNILRNNHIYLPSIQNKDKKIEELEQRLKKEQYEHYITKEELRTLKNNLKQIIS